MSKKTYRIVGTGKPCPRCGKNSQAREHLAILEKQLRQPFYYTRWYNCFNKDCKTTIFMFDEDKVWNNNKSARELQDFQEYQEKMDFIRNI